MHCRFELISTKSRRTATRRQRENKLIQINFCIKNIVVCYQHNHEFIIYIKKTKTRVLDLENIPTLLSSLYFLNSFLICYIDMDPDQFVRFLCFFNLPGAQNSMEYMCHALQKLL